MRAISQLVAVFGLVNLGRIPVEHRGLLTRVYKY